MRDSDRESATEKKAARVGAFLEALGGDLGLAGLQDGVLTSISIRMPTEEEPSALLVVKATSAKGKHIAFVGAFKVTDALLAWRAKSASGSIKWREDVPWSQRAAGNGLM